MKKNGSVSSHDRFYFAGDIVYRQCKEGWLAVSVQSANWIVINNFQKEILERFIAGDTVGDVYSIINSEDKLNNFKKLLAAIFARQFANTEKIPNIQYLEGFKMLNCYITNACNLKCEHCFMLSGEKLKNELTANEWKCVLKDFKTEGGETVTFSGGEPLMNVSFEDIVKYASTIGLSVTVLSNGILWNDDKIIKLAPYINEIQISIDGVDEQTNAKVRGSGHFDKIVNTVIQFANLGVRTSVATTFTFKNLENNMDERYKQFVTDIKSQCKNPVFFKLSKKILKGRETNYTDAENLEFFQRILKIEEGLDPYAKYNNYMEGHTPNLVEKNCGFGGISIGADGEVYYCNRISEVESYGNVRDNSIKLFMEKARKIHLQTSVDVLTPCKDCHLRYICCGGCRIDECNFHGKLKGFNGELCQIKCNEESIRRLERKMIDSFLFYYKF